MVEYSPPQTEIANAPLVGIYADAARMLRTPSNPNGVLWTSIVSVASEVYGGMGTQLARRPDESTMTAFDRFAESHPGAAALALQGAGGRDTLRRTLNRIRGHLLNEATVVWRVDPL